MPNHPDKIYWDILDPKRQEILPFLDSFKDDFYLAGGTALALHLGHRDSIDFDFFSPTSFVTTELFRKIEETFIDTRLIKTQDEENTLTIIINEVIKISFFSYPYPVISPLVETDHFQMASLEDIGAMKLSAVTSRSLLKDYVDIYFILQRIDLLTLIQLTHQKLPTIDPNLILKSLVYFEDIEFEPIIFKHGHSVDLPTIQKFLVEKVKSYIDLASQSLDQR